MCFFFLGSVFSYHFVSTCKLMTAGIHPPITINMTFLCMPAVSSWARYILVFRLLSFHGRQGGRFIAAFSFLDNFFVLDIPHVFVVCLAALCPGVIHGSPNSLPAPSVRGIRGTILPLPPRLGGRITPPRPHSVALALFSWIISSAIVNISWILSSLTSLSILTQHSPVLVRSSPLAFTRSVIFCLSSSDVYL